MSIETTFHALIPAHNSHTFLPPSALITQQDVNSTERDHIDNQVNHISRKYRWKLSCWFCRS